MIKIIFGILIISSPCFSQQPENMLDPTGYYLSNPKKLFDGYSLGFIHLYIQKLEKNRVAQLSDTMQLKGELRINSGSGKDKKSITIDAKRAIVRYDSLYLEFTNPKFGKLSIDGRFVDTHGEFWNNSSIVTDSTIVLNARIIVRKGEKITYENQRTFTYWEGD